ncbi:MAK10-like protein [Tanacetum coccineum]
MVPLRSDTIQLVQNGCSFYGFRSDDPNQNLKDFVKLVDSLDHDDENKERTHLRLFQFSLRDQASNWLERLPAGSITTWEDLTTRFLAQFFPPGRTAKLRNDILMFQQHHGESLSEAWTQDLALYDNESWNDPRDFAKPVKAIALPQNVRSTSDRRLIELKNQAQRLMDAHLAPTQPTQVNKVTTLCEICSGPHDTQYCVKDPEQAFVKYASSRNDEVRGSNPTVQSQTVPSTTVLKALTINQILKDWYPISWHLKMLDCPSWSTRSVDLNVSVAMYGYVFICVCVGYVRLDNQSIERYRLIGIGFVLNFVKFISFTFGDKEMISVIEAVLR